MERGVRRRRFRRGLEAYRLGRLDEALEIFRHVVDAGSSEPEHISYLGLLQAVRERKRSEAIDLCNRAVLLAPDDPQMHINLARVHAATGRKVRAGEVLRSALLTMPGNALILSELDRVFPRDPDPISFLGRNHFLNRLLNPRKREKGT